MPEVKKAPEAPKTIAAPKAVEKAVEKAVAPKAVEKKPTVKKAAPAKEIPVAKKEAAPKTAAASKKTTAPKDVKVSVIVEHHDRQIGTDTIVKTAEKLWVKAGHDVAQISKVELYIKQEDGAVYCVVNGEAVGKYDL